MTKSSGNTKDNRNSESQQNIFIKNLQALKLLIKCYNNKEESTIT